MYTSVFKKPVEQSLRSRVAARHNKDWQSADEIKMSLQRLGVAINDTPGGTIAQYVGREHYGDMYKWYIPSDDERTASSIPNGCIEVDAVVWFAWRGYGSHHIGLVRAGYDSGRDNVWVHPFNDDILTWSLVRACLLGAVCELDVPDATFNNSNLDGHSVTVRLGPVGEAWEIVDFLPCSEPRDMAFPLLYEEPHGSYMEC